MPLMEGIIAESIAPMGAHAAATAVSVMEATIAARATSPAMNLVREFMSPMYRRSPAGSTAASGVRATPRVAAEDRLRCGLGAGGQLGAGGRHAVVAAIGLRRRAPALMLRIRFVGTRIRRIFEQTLHFAKDE